MSNEQLLYVWIFLPFFIASVVLLLILYKKYGIFRGLWRMGIPKLTGPTIVLTALTLLLLLRIFTNWAAALGTWGTLLVAFAAFWAIRSSNEQNRRIRQETLDKENRDRKERYLDEVIDWAEEILKCGKEPTRDIPIVIEDSVVGQDLKPSSTAAMAVNWLRTEVINTERRYASLLSKEIYLVTMSNRLKISFDKHLRNTIDELAKHIQLIRKYRDEFGNITDFDAATLNKRSENVLAINKNSTVLEISALRLAEEVTKAKADLNIS